MDMGDFLRDIDIPEVDEVLRQDDMWHALGNLPLCMPQDNDTHSICTLASEGSMDIPREDDLMDMSEYTVGDCKDQEITIKADKDDIGDFKNCMVTNISDNDARQKAIDFINALPDNMNVSGITLEVKFDESLVKTESVTEAADGVNAKSEIHNIPVSKVSITDEPIGTEPIADVPITKEENAEAEVKVGKKGGKKKALCGHYICGICGEVYKHRANLSRHRTQRHKPTSATKCPDCGKVLKRPDYLKGHMVRCAKTRVSSCT